MPARCGRGVWAEAPRRTKSASQSALTNTSENAKTYYGFIVPHPFSLAQILGPSFGEQGKSRRNRRLAAHLVVNEDDIDVVGEVGIVG